MAPNYNTVTQPQVTVNDLLYHDLTKRNYSLVVNQTWGGRNLPMLEESFSNMK